MVLDSLGEEQSGARREGRRKGWGGMRERERGREGGREGGIKGRVEGVTGRKRGKEGEGREVYTEGGRGKK